MATHPAPTGKPAFAKRAGNFVGRAPPGFRALWIGGAAALALAILTGPFHTFDMPPAQRSAFWLLLMGWNLAKWQAWFWLTVREPGDWRRASAVGAVVVNVTLPVEIGVALRLVGIDRAPAGVPTWATAIGISAVVFAGLTALRRAQQRAATAPAPHGPLARSGLALAELAAIEAEDHYCRFHRRDGTSNLIHARFADALADVAAIDGLQTHRGAWVAAAAVASASRAGRRWRLRLADGRDIPVSARHLAAVRARGWLARRRPG